MLTYSRILWIPYLLTVSFYFIEGFFPDYEILPDMALALESIMAMIIGYAVILLDVRASLKRCAMLAAMIGVIRFLMGLLNLVLSQPDSANDYAAAFIGYLIASAIVTGVYALLGLIGGILRLAASSGK